MLAVGALLLKLELLRDVDVSVASLAVAFAIAIAVLVVAQLVLDRTVLRNVAEHPVSLWVVGAVAVVLGLVVTAPFAIVLATDGISLGPPVRGLLLSSIARSALAVSLLAYVLGLRTWYRGARDHAEQALLAAEGARVRAGDSVSATRALVIETARQGLDRSHGEAAELLDAASRTEAAEDYALAAESMRTAARAAVRSTSHDLWVEERRSGPAIRWRSIVPEALARYPLPLWLPIIGAVGYVLARTEPFAGNSAVALAAVAVALAVLCTAYLAGRAVIAAWPGSAVAVTVIAVCVGLIGAAFAGLAPVGRQPAPASLVVGCIVFLAMAAGVSVAQMVRDSGAMVIQVLMDDRMRADTERVALEQVQAELSRELAAYLHGTVQPTLVAASMALDQAARGGDPDALRQAAAQAQQALQMGVQLPGTAAPRTVAQVADAVRARWGTMLGLEVQVHLDPGDDRSAEDVARVLDEFLNNAVVHGHATEVSVDISRDDRDWIVVVADDGVGPAGGPPGLGTAMLDAVAAGGWSLEPGAQGGAVARARVPAAAPAV